MKQLIAVCTFVAAVAAVTASWGQGARHSLSARAASVGAPASGEVSLTAGGSFEPTSGLLQVRGALRVTRAFADGPLAGDRVGENVRWEGANIIPSFSFETDGAGRTAVTDATTLVLQAELFRSGDGVAASQRAKMIVSASDLDAAQDGVQNVWIEGVGFGSAEVSIH